MAIRVEGDTESLAGQWIDFREEGWTFGDRRKVLQADNDFDVLEIVLTYIADWNLLDFAGNPVAWEAPAELDLMDDLDDLTVNFIVRAWFIARAQRGELKKA